MTIHAPAAALCRRSATALSSLLALAWSAGAAAQTAPLAAADSEAEVGTGTASESGTSNARATVYQAAYFTQFAPTNALDIVRRVPGFQIEETDDNVRGFSGAAGNVVFNGARPASKSEALSAILARIPAGRVLRVEVAAGDLYGSDYAGKSQVLNVVMSRTGGIDGNVKATVTRAFNGEVWPNLQGSVLIRAGQSTFNLSAGAGRTGQVEEGYDDLRRFSDNSRIELREKTNDIRNYNPFVSLAWSHDGGKDRTANVNLRYAPGRLSLKQANRVIPTTGAIRDDRLEQDYRNTSYELGGDITRPLGGGALKFVALANRRDRNNFDSNYNRVGDVAVGGFEQSQVARYDEVLGRLSWSHPSLLGFSTEFGGEVAYNRLENATELYLLGAGGTRRRIDLPIDRAVVDELRGEAYANFGRQLTGNLRLDTTLAFEASRLKVAGDTTAQRSLSFFKPGVTLGWKAPGGWQIQAALRREVAQLDFYDFISSAEITNERVNGGNANLLPQRSWEARLTVERPILGRGQVRLELGYDRVSMLQDRVLTPEGFDAPGNIGTGTRKFATLTVDAPLDQLGLAKTRLRVVGSVNDTSVRDPLTGRDRVWNEFFAPWNWNVELRRDLAQWSYGMTLADRADYVFHRADEIDRLILARPYATAFVEYRPDRRTTLRLDLENAFNTPAARFREFYSPNRTTANPVVTEYRRRNSHTQVALSLNRTFGGANG